MSPPREHQPSHHVTSVRFHRYKAFRDYSLSLQAFNILVGPNNCGKSTVIGAFRVLAESLRRARARKPALVQTPTGEGWGYAVDLAATGISSENVFYDYDDSRPATINLRVSNGNELQLFFPERDTCSLICQATGRPIRTTTQFRSEFNLSIGFVPILGPVDHDEHLFQREAARLALVTHGAARNFRNIWYHFPEGFDKFRSLIQTTWPGMDIDAPEVDYNSLPARIHMFCPEDRIPREIYWAGFGFQVWAQMLTHIVKNANASLFLIDEPDIYLHSDLQRQLLSILKTLGPDILIATHSTELISEADPDDILIVNKRASSARRVRDPGRLISVFQSLGSNLNPVLTQLARTRRVVFVEGKDFQILSRFARLLALPEIANRSSFAVVPAEGFNPTMVRDFKRGIETTLGTLVAGAVVFDRDYRSDQECDQERKQLEQHCEFVRIHERKEIENYLLSERPIRRAIDRRLEERAQRTGEVCTFEGDIATLLDGVTEGMRRRVESRYLAKRRDFERSQNSKLADTTIDERLLQEFEDAWADTERRLKMVPGKDVLAELNARLQEEIGVTVSHAAIVASFRRSEVPADLEAMLVDLHDFCKE